MGGILILVSFCCSSGVVKVDQLVVSKSLNGQTEVAGLRFSWC
jgi:hypothetical protein